MPFHSSIVINETTTAYFWKITEDFNTLFRAVKLKDVSLARLETMKAESHQNGFLAVRMLLQHIGFSDFDLYYDENGKPHLEKKEDREKKKDLHISISHSFDFSCICISSDKIIGIDMEIVKPKILRIAPRFMDIKHIEGLPEAEQIEKATVIWGIKEAIFKIKNEKGISFPNHIFENIFCLSDSSCQAELRFNEKIENFHIQFYPVEDYIFVCALPE